jgi:hypothetical protein
LRLDVNEFFNLPNPSSLSWLKWVPEEKK